jgi:hypothetical protein
MPSIVWKNMEDQLNLKSNRACHSTERTTLVGNNYSLIAS